jgi:hypothetical protein
MVADHYRVEDSKKLRDENAAINLELGTLISENQAARKQAEAALAAAERIQMFGTKQAKWWRRRSYSMKR